MSWASRLGLSLVVFFCASYGIATGLVFVAQAEESSVYDDFDLDPEIAAIVNETEDRSDPYLDSATPPQDRNTSTLEMIKKARPLSTEEVMTLMTASHQLRDKDRKLSLEVEKIASKLANM